MVSWLNTQVPEGRFYPHCPWFSGRTDIDVHVCFVSFVRKGRRPVVRFLWLRTLYICYICLLRSSRRVTGSKDGPRRSDPRLVSSVHLGSSEDYKFSTPTLRPLRSGPVDLTRSVSRPLLSRRVPHSRGFPGVPQCRVPTLLGWTRTPFLVGFPNVPILIKGKDSRSHLLESYVPPSLSHESPKTEMSLRFGRDPIYDRNKAGCFVRDVPSLMRFYFEFL